MGPAALPPPIQARAVGLTRSALAEAGLRAKFASVGAEPGALSGAEFAAFLAKERATWGKVIEASGTRAD